MTKRQRIEVQRLRDDSEELKKLKKEYIKLQRDFDESQLVIGLLRRGGTGLLKYYTKEQLSTEIFERTHDPKRSDQK